MSNISYISLSQATALERNLNLTAHNLANANTAGFKALQPLFESVEDSSSENNISYVQDRGTYLDTREGALVPTGNPFDVAISGDGWFSFQIPGDEPAYGRHGRLILDVDGQLKTSGGYPILDAGGGPVALPDDAGADITITAGGAITDSTGAVLGNIGVFTIEQGAQMLSLGGGMYQLPSTAAAPQPAETAQVKQGFVEGSNVQAVLEMTRLIDVQRAYENAVKLMNEDDGLLQNAIQTLGPSG